jgi:3-phytase
VGSDQVPGGSDIRIYRREGQLGRPHAHDPAIASILTMADSTDGLEVVSEPLGPRFPRGVLIMMNSAGRNFQLYDWRDIERFLGLEISVRRAN